jgi:adenine-specific DNA-methyltransferase
MMEATVRQTVLYNTIYKRKKRLPLSAHDRRKSLYQAVSASSPTGNRARTAYLLCIKDGTNIDPPYNTGKDFVYPDNYSDPLETYLQLTGQKDSDGNLLTSNPDTGGRYHSAWLSMMYPRLFLARQLLQEDGVIFVSIDDNEVHNLRMIMNEIFGEDEFIGCLIWKRRQNIDSRAKTGISVDHEYLIAYRRGNIGRLRGQEKDLTKYSNPDNDQRGDWLSGDLTGLATKEQRPNLHYDLVNPETGISYPCPENGWRFGKPTMARLINDKRIIWPQTTSGRPRVKRYLRELTDEFSGLSSVVNTVFNTQATRELKDLFDGREVLDFPKPKEYIKLLIQQGSKIDENDIVLDFFAGSCTTAHAVLEQNREDGGNRKFIMVQLPEPTGNPEFPTIADIGKERIRRVIKKLEEEKSGRLDMESRETPEDLGFRVFKLAESNVKPWAGVEEADAETWIKQMELFADPLQDEWKPVNLIWETAVKEGYTLTSTIERLPHITANAVYKVADNEKGQSFLICVDEELKPDTPRALQLDRDTLFICRDIAITDNQAANLALMCRLKTI